MRPPGGLAGERVICVKNRKDPAVLLSGAATNRDAPAG